MTNIVISDVSKSYSERLVLKNIDLKIKQGEFITIFGPNGCGKTTLLNIIAGIDKPDKGTVNINAGNEKLHQKTIGYVFQNYRDSLLPWKTNIENIAFPLELNGISKQNRLTKAKNLVKKLDIHLPLFNYPYQSSGGEQQLTAILREVLMNSKIILMDEPFSAIHQENRDYLKIKIQDIWKRLGLTIIFVTHDINEAIQLGNHIILMKSSPGEIVCEYIVDFPRPRTEDIFFSGKFHDLKKKILSEMRK